MCISRLSLFKLLAIPFILWLPSRSMGLELSPPQPKDTLSMTIFAGGTLSLSWIVNASDPPLFDLILVGEADGLILFPGIRSADSPLELLVNYTAQKYFFRAVENPAGETLAESSMFEVTSAPRILSVSNSDDSPWLTTTNVVAIPKTTESQTFGLSTRTERGTIIGAIVGGVLGAAVVVAVAAVLIWRWRVRRRRRTSGRPILIDDDALSKTGREVPPLLPVYAQMLSPFRMPSESPPSMLTPGLARLQPVHPSSGHRQSLGQPSSSGHHRSQPRLLKLEPVRPPSKYQSPGPHSPTSHPWSSKYDPTRSPVSTQHSRASYSPVSSKRVSHHRKFSYDIPAPSLLSSRLPQSRRSSHFPEERNTERRRIRPAGTERPDQLQVDLETAASETLYEKDEPETPLKPPTRRHPLRTRSEPRPLSSEFGSTEGHELGEQIQQHPSVDGSGSLGNAESNEPQATAVTAL
ncbi:hypothetical protein C8F04DRAFT_1098779 [Mycena alexandri]|uniref:Fibronectin type-III domain-containing protein n=1 Tax=Mycena alexandri TaxID=1745969 RepID=A0AAD6SWV7_9AGAR|nr:hypothetical protein C8F04DRAFT_1098779 [Mycena alexandri]